MGTKIISTVILWIAFATLTTFAATHTKTFNEFILPFFICFVVLGVAIFAPMIYNTIKQGAEKKTESSD
jgi:hypothetical protein